jgi:hypothetical protein
VIIAALPTQWRARASDLERFAPAAAQAFRECADQLVEAHQSAEESVSLKEASLLGGYSIDALQKMVAAGRLANAGRKGKPRIKRLEVPIKPGHHATFLQDALSGGYVDPTAVVASVKARGKNP